MFKLFIILLVAGIIELGFLFFVADSDMLEVVLTNEVEKVQYWFGKDGANSIVKKTNSIYETAFVSTGLVETSFALTQASLISEDDPLFENRSDGIINFTEHIQSWLNGRITAFWRVIYHAIVRLYIFVEWVPFIVLLTLPAVVEGLVRREIKKISFGYSSPVIYNAALQTLPFTIALPAIYLFLPMDSSPIIPLLWGVLMSGLQFFMFSNLQKRI